jgi:hypothetical protein
MTSLTFCFIIGKNSALSEQIFSAVAFISSEVFDVFSSMRDIVSTSFCPRVFYTQVGGRSNFFGKAEWLRRSFIFPLFSLFVFSHVLFAGIHKN